MTSVCPFAATSRVSYYQQKLLGKKLGYNKPEIAHRFLWENTGVKRVLHIDILDGIIKDGAVSDNNLRLLVDNIVIHESDGKLSINIDLKAAFSSHLDIYDEDGALTAKAFATN